MFFKKTCLEFLVCVYHPKSRLCRFSAALSLQSYLPATPVASCTNAFFSLSYKFSRPNKTYSTLEVRGQIYSKIRNFKDALREDSS